jgi:hypothetical protein
MELMRDHFLRPFTKWCEANGCRSRVQAYGREFHPLDASLEVDIPECETWLWDNDGTKGRDLYTDPAYTNVNKFVASAAHFQSKKEVSCEESTNTAAVFNATLERIKRVGDQSNLSGVTHSIFHGFNYTPLEAPFPGWIRYGTFFNERNPWWPYLRLYTDYKARLSALLRETKPFADILVLHPLADLWTRLGPQRDPFPEQRYPPYQYRVWEAIHRNGSACDYASEHVLQHFDLSPYKVLLLLEVESIEPATTQALLRFARSGGKLVFVGNTPHRAPGRKGQAENDEAVRRDMQALREDYPSQCFRVEAPADGIDPDAWWRLVAGACDIRPYLRFSAPNHYLSQIRHRTAEGGDVLFLVNSHATETYRFDADFLPAGGRQPWLWDAETGLKSPYPTLGENGRLQVELPPATSLLIVYETAGTTGEGTSPTPPPKAKAAAEAVPVEGWSLRLEPLFGQGGERKPFPLKDLATDPATRAFAGHLYYEATAKLPEGCRYLDLGRVYGVSELKVNGQALGCHWYGRHRYLLPEGLAAGMPLRLEVKVATTVGNYLKSNPANKTGYAWTRAQPWQPVGMLGPVSFC